MSITTTQTCDGCGTTRPLRAGYYGQPRDIGAAARVGGWCEVKTDKHLCSDCIRGATTRTEAL